MAGIKLTKKINYNIIDRDMRVVIKSIGVAFLVVVVGLLLVPAAVAAHATIDSGGTAGGCCGTICAPQCCQPADVEPADCILSSEQGEQAVLSRFVSSLKKSPLLTFKTGPVLTPVAVTDLSPRGEFVQESPGEPPVRYHCRNCLDSDEPAQIQPA